MKKLPIGMQTFKDIVTGNYVYVDKTRYVYDLLTSKKYYFLSRPRRFGKSLLLDTIAEAFGGDKELFKGLWIYDSGYAFPKHPVIRLDMSNIPNETAQILKYNLMDECRHIAKKENVDINGDEPSVLFKRLIENMMLKYDRSVVVLIDEYDKPILDHITDLEVVDDIRTALRDFYGILKSMDPHLRFTFITGVTKFTKTSIFSGLNNLSDISLMEKYANICGIPVDSLDVYFGEYMESLSTHKRFVQYENIHDEILRWYDGYSWDGETKVINPFSLLNFFDQERFSAFWYATGTPRFLLDLIKKQPASYVNLRNVAVSETMLDSVEPDKITLEPLLFQTGYLTVRDIPMTTDEPAYILDLPNFEVRNAFNVHVMAALADQDDVRTGQMRMGIRDALVSGDLPKMLDILRGFFASIPYNLHVDLEAYYHSLFYALLSALGFEMALEVSTSKGRSDATLALADKVYVMEFKYRKCPKNASAERKRKLFDEALDEAMAQIHDRGYSAKYQGGGKTIYEAAFAFLGRGEIEMRVEETRD